MNRYVSKNIITNFSDIYEKYFEDRNVKFINHYESPLFVFPNQEQINNTNTIEHIWSFGDKYFKLASKYYGDPKLWWVLAMYNKKPTEQHINLGDTILIPTLLERLNIYMKP